MDNYADLKQLERHIANDVTPSRTTTDILANLKLLNETSLLSKNDPANNPIAAIAKEEIKYLNAAMTALKDNQILRDRFGTGLQAAMDVSVLIKDRFNKKVFDKVMDSALGAGGADLNVNRYVNSRISLGAPITPARIVAEE